MSSYMAVPPPPPAVPPTLRTLTAKKRLNRGVHTKIFRAVFESRSSFFAPKLHGHVCYAG